MLLKNGYTLSGALVVVMLLLAGCAATGEQSAPAPEPKAGTILIFQETEPDADPARMVYFVNQDMMRINEWQETEDFVLFDRRSRTIYNVVAKDKTILVIEDRPITVPSPVDYTLVEKKEESAAAIRNTDGNKAWHYKYMIGDQVCYNTVSIPDYLNDVVAALSEFREVLAGEHAKTLPNTPADVLDPCDLAMNIFEPGRFLDKGFPLREWDQRGYQRFLMDVRHDRVPPANVLTLPEDFKRYSIPSPGGE